LACASSTRFGLAGGHLRGLGLAPNAFEVGELVQRGGLAQRQPGGVLDAEDFAGVRVHDEPDGLARQLVGHLEALAEIGHRAVLAHEAADAMMEHGVELRGLGAQAADFWQVTLVARKRGQTIQAAVHGLVVHLLEPGPQACVELVQIGDAPLVELAEKLVAARSVPAFELALGNRSQLHVN
jgi:hypothetical protein